MIEYLLLNTGLPVHACILGLILLGLKVLKNE